MHRVPVMARPPFIDGFDYRGPHAYSLTCCVHQRNACLTDASVSAMVIGELDRTTAQSHFEVLAYCVMPDHLHALVQGTSADAALRAFVKLWRQRTAIAFSRARGQRLWQVGYWERTVRSSEDLRRVASYIVANPVRAGLADSVDGWPFVGGSLVEKR
jgi:putative transposase